MSISLNFVLHGKRGAKAFASSAGGRPIDGGPASCWVNWHPLSLKQTPGRWIGPELAALKLAIAGVLD